MERKQKELDTNMGRIFNAFLFECKDCNLFFATPVDVDPEVCPFCHSHEISEDCEDAIIIADGSIFWG